MSQHGGLANRMGAGGSSRRRRGPGSGYGPAADPATALSGSGLVDLEPEAFVRLAYEMTWRRSPTADELDAGVRRVGLGDLQRHELLDDLQSNYGMLPFPVALHLAYLMLIRREPDPDGARWVREQFDSGELDRWGLLDWLRGTGDFVSLGTERLASAIHTSRCHFVRSLPPANRILDLGGTDLGHVEGAMVSMGWPYDFDELVIVDLPSEDRHELYQRSPAADAVDTERGPVRYEYHSMTDLSRYRSGSFDLVYAGQSFEHVTEADGDEVLDQIRRVLRPGGTFALDTPNGPVCRLQQPEFIDPDHEVEYSEPQLAAKLEAAGFTISGRWGLVHGGRPVLEGRFDPVAAAHNEGLYDDVTHCYLLALTCRT